MTESNEDRAAEGRSSSSRRKVVVGLGVFACFFAFLFIGLLHYGTSTSTATIREFFARAQKASAVELEKTFHKDLKGDCDKQLLALFIKTISKELGAFKEPKLSGFSFSDSTENGHRLRRYKGTMIFEKGKLPLELGFIDDKLNAFYVTDVAAAKPLLAKRGLPKDTKRYEKRAEAFWRALFTGRADELFAMMSPALQKKVGKEGIKAQVARLQNDGALKSLHLYSTFKDTQNNDKIMVITRCVSEKMNVKGHVVFKIDGLRSHLVAYQIPSSMVRK